MCSIILARHVAASFLATTLFTNTASCVTLMSWRAPATLTTAPTTAATATITTTVAAAVAATAAATTQSARH